MICILNTFKIPLILSEAQSENCIFVGLDTKTQERHGCSSTFLLEKKTINKQSTE